MVTPTVDPWHCPDGRVHSWTYLGRRMQAYRCVLCVNRISKSLLKELTDNA